MSDLAIIGGGLAGSEAAWQAAQLGLKVELFEMRPRLQTGAHQSDHLAELVCSNSLGSKLVDRAGGLLKEEIRRMGSLLLKCAEAAALPAGEALAVDREAFAALVTAQIQSHPNIRIRREEVKEILSKPAVIASGPLTSPTLSGAIASITGKNHLFFYDAIAPVITFESIDMEIAFRGSRFGHGENTAGDYINSPLSKEEYGRFISALLEAERVTLLEFEKEIENGVKAGPDRFFEGCLPIEILAKRGGSSLAFGPLRPIGLRDPRTGMRPFAVVQLRQDNLAGSLYNLVGFQTNLKFPEQRRVFRMLPGLEHADFARFGQMHRNTFIFSPAFLRPTLQSRVRNDLFFAGQITGIEGYVGNIASGLLAGMNAARLIQGKELIEPPATTMLGALCRYITESNEKDFQPMKANFGLMPPLSDPGVHGKRNRANAYACRALEDLDNYLTGYL